MRSPTILITGFGAFPGTRTNPSQALVRAIRRRRQPALSDIRLVTHIFPVTYQDIDAALPELLAKHKPDIVLMFGLATRTRFVRIEAQARNSISALFPDASGGRAVQHAIDPAGLSILRTRAPVERLRRIGLRHGIDTRLSRNAGRYVCNYVYWRALAAAKKLRPPPLALFVHIPLIDTAKRPRGKAKPRISMPELVRFCEALLVELKVAKRNS